MPVQIEKLYSLQVIRQAENDTVQIDMTAWEDAFPSAAFRVFFKPPDAVAPDGSVTSSYANHVLSFTLSASASVDLGVGYTEVRAVDATSGNALKSRIIPTSVVESAADAAGTDWINTVLLQKNATEEAALVAARDAEQTVANAIRAYVSAVVDATLAIAGRTADAKATGERLNALEARIDAITIPEQ
jgi:hypothetical protein